MLLVNSSMLSKISSYYFVDYPSISDHKLLVVYCKKTTTDESFWLPKKKIFFNGIGINVLNLKKKYVITINLRFLVKK